MLAAFFQLEIVLEESKECICLLAHWPSRPAFLVGLSGQGSPDLFHGGRAQLGEEQFDAGSPPMAASIS